MSIMSQFKTKFKNMMESLVGRLLPQMLPTHASGAFGACVGAAENS